MAAANVNVKEIDKSTRVPSFPGLYASIALPINRGPLEPTLITDQTQLLDLYTLNGKTYRGINNAFYSAEIFLTKSNKLWVNRACKNPLYGGLEVQSALLNENVKLELSYEGSTVLLHVVYPEFEVDPGYSVDGIIKLTSGDLTGATVTWKIGGEAVGEPFVVPADFKSIRCSEAFGVPIARLNDESGKDMNWVFEITGLDLIPVFTVEINTIAWTGTYDANNVLVLGSSAKSFSNTKALSEGLSDPTAVEFTEDVGAFLVYGANPGAWNNSIGIKLFTYENYPEKVKLPGAMLIQVFINGNNNVAVDEMLVSRVESAKDGYNRNIFMDSKSEESNYIRLFSNPLVDAEAKINDIIDIKWLSKGDDGEEVTDGAMLSAIEPFDSKETYPMTIIMDGGWTTPAFQTGLINLAETRKDCVANLSIPYSCESSSSYMNDIVDYKLNQLNNTSSYAAIYTPHLKVYDKDRDEAIYISPEGFASAAVADTASNYEIWYPAAGWRRGKLNVLDTRRRFSKGEMDYLYDNSINPIRFSPGKGIAIWGQKTLQAIPSDLDRLNVRYLLIVIETAVSEALEDYLFELNDEGERLNVKLMIDTYMLGIKGRRGVYDFEVVCDKSNNSDSDIANNRMNVDIYLKPMKAIEEITVRAILTPTGVDFSTLKSGV